LIVERLPKTRSGKILRRIIKNIINDEEYKPPATIDDESILTVIHKLSVKNGFNDACFRPD
jgi:propionyl-CoA synthetase